MGSVVGTGEVRSREGAALSAQDRIILELARRDTDPAMHLGLVLMLDGPAPTVEQLAGHLASRLPTMPELTFRLAGPARRPAWEPDPDFDVRRHVHEYRPADGRADDPDRVLAAMLDQPLTRDRPLWGVWLIVGTDGYALCYRAHHAFQDGRAAAETCERFFGPPREPAFPTRAVLTPAVPAPAAPDRSASWSTAVLKDLLPPMRRTTRWSALDRPPTGQRRVCTTAVELSRLHAIGRATGASVNQICLAAVTATLRAWHPQDWAAPGRELRATLAINIRTPDDPYRLLGNRGGVAAVPLPCSEPVPVRQLDQLQEQVSYARMAELGRRHRVLYQRMPYWCGRVGLNRSIDPRYTPLTLADVRLRKPLGFAGTVARSVHPLPVSVPGQPLFVVWSTYRKRLHTTFLADAGAVGAVGADRLGLLWQQGINDLERSVHGGS